MGKSKTRLQRDKARRLSRLPSKSETAVDKASGPQHADRTTESDQTARRGMDAAARVQLMRAVGRMSGDVSTPRAESGSVQPLKVTPADDETEHEAAAAAKQVEAGRQVDRASRAESESSTDREPSEEPASRQVAEDAAAMRQEDENAQTVSEPAAQLQEQMQRTDREADEPTNASRQVDEESVSAQLSLTADSEPASRMQDEPTKASRQTDDESVSAQVSRSDESEPVSEMQDEATTKRKADSTHREANRPDQPDTQTAAELLTQKGMGRPLDPAIRRRMESAFSADFSEVRVHEDAVAHRAAEALAARAFTRGNDIFFAQSESAANTKLLAHELTHVVQQNPNASRGQAVGRATDEGEVQRQPAAKPKEADATMPAGIIELQNKPKLEPPADVVDYLSKQKRRTGEVRVQFGNLAKGTAKIKRITKDGDQYKLASKASLPLTHPLLASFAGADSKIVPTLMVRNAGDGAVKGCVGYGKAANISSAFRKYPELLGVPGFKIGGLSNKNFTNELKGGQLTLALTNVDLRLGRVFAGTFSLSSVNGRSPSFEGKLNVTVKKLAKNAEIELKRSEKGLVTAKGDVAVDLPKNFSGQVTVEWDGEAVSGVGKVGYAGEKMSGSVTLQVMEAGKAKELGEQKKAPEQKQPAKGGGKKKGVENYVLFGEGELDFSFTEWLSGKAQVIVDQAGFVTVIGQIKPQKEIELFPQTDYIKKLFKLEARAAYGVPVVGNIFVFGNVGMDALAKVGPGKLYNISVDGTYSNDPKKANDFSVRGSLNVSAAAGLRLRGEAGVGLEILAHDIKAGAGVNGIAAVRGYAEATPVIGYREKVGETPEDKKGEFFIRGDMEIAAQPFLGLSGDLFVELDSPWWSPAPDKKWTWPLGSLEYPVGGTLGIGASVDYVFGSKQAPAVEFKPVQFDGQKFLTDLYTDKAKPKSGDKGEQPGKWKEKNSKEAAPPPKEGKKGGAQEGKAAPPPPAKSKVQPGGPKIAKKPADPNARTADGRSVRELQEETRRKGKKPQAKKPMADANGEQEKGAERDPKAVKSAALDAVRKSAREDIKSIEHFGKIVDSVEARFRGQGLKRLRANADPKSLRIAVEATASDPEQFILSWADVFHETPINPSELKSLEERFTKQGKETYAAIAVNGRLVASARNAKDHAEMELLGSAAAPNDQWMNALSIALDEAGTSGSSIFTLLVSRSPCASTCAPALARWLRSNRRRYSSIEFRIAASANYAPVINIDDLREQLVTYLDATGRELRVPLQQLTRDQLDEILSEVVPSFSTTGVRRGDATSMADLAKLQSAGWSLFQLQLGKVTKPSAKLLRSRLKNLSAKKLNRRNS